MIHTGQSILLNFIVVTEFTMSGFLVFLKKLDAFAARIYSILFHPAQFACDLKITSEYDSTFWEAAKLYLKIFSAVAGVWIYLLYILGGQTIANTLFGAYPDGEKVFYILLAVASTLLPAAILFLALRLAHGRALTLPLFLQVFFHVAGAVLIIVAVVALVTAALVLLFPISPDQAMSRKLTLLEAAGYPALCDKVHSFECQLSLRFGASLYYILSFFLFATMLYQSILMATMVNKIFNARRHYPIYIAAVALAVVVPGLIFILELLAYASNSVGSGINQIVTYSRCANLLQKGDPERAKPYCEHAARARPDYDAAHANLCVALAQLEDFDGALDACNEAVRRKRSAVTHLVRGAAYARMKQFGNAIEDFEASNKHMSGGALLFFMRGEAFSELRKYQEALDDFLAAEAKGMRNAKLYVARAKTHIRLSKVADAEEDLSRAEVLDSRSAELYTTKGLILRIRKDHAGALKALNRAIELDRKNDAAYRGRCGHSDGRVALDRLKDCDEAVKLKPEQMANYFVRGDVLSRMNNKELALANYGTALYLLKIKVLEDKQKESKDNLVRARDLGNLAFISVLAGRYEDALTAAKDALDLTSGQIWIEMNKAHALVFQGRGRWREEAKAIYVARKGEMWGGRKWEELLAEDFNQLRTAVTKLDDRLSNRISKFFEEVEWDLNIGSTKGVAPELNDLQ
jgi:tetratricopeptide (TPR) repeat protein